MIGQNTNITLETAAPKRLNAGDPQIREVLTLIKSAFAYMEGRIDPPSSMHRLDIAAVEKQCSSGDVWCIGSPAKACVFLEDKDTVLYISKLAVAEDQRGMGLARKLIELAEKCAKQKGLKALELNTRIELIENHRTFARLGFQKTAEKNHEGFDRPTYIVMQRPI